MAKPHSPWRAENARYGEHGSRHSAIHISQAHGKVTYARYGEHDPVQLHLRFAGSSVYSLTSVSPFKVGAAMRE